MKCAYIKIRAGFIALLLGLSPASLLAQDVPPSSSNANNDNADITMTLYRDMVFYLDVWSSWRNVLQKAKPSKSKMLSLYENDALSILIIDPDTKPPSNKYLGYNQVKFYKSGTSSVDKSTSPYDIKLQQGSYLINNNGVIKQSQPELSVEDKKVLENKVRKQVGNVINASG